MIATAVIVHVICKHAKLKSLVTGIVFQTIKGTDAIFSSISDSENCTCKVQWYTIVAMRLMIIGLTFFILATTRKCIIYRGHLFSTAVMVILFFSDVNQYVPPKLGKTAGSIHLFIRITTDQITLERRLLLDVVQIDWKEVIITLNGNMILLPTPVIIIPMRDIFRLRCII